MALGDFLNNQSLGSWADEMDAQPIPAVPAYSSRSRDAPGEGRAFTQSNWGESRGPREPRGGDSFGDRQASYEPRFAPREAVEFPTKPPYTAHLGNLDYNVTSVDVEGFLSDCQVTTVRIMEDKVDRKPKGFGYVEFATPEGLRAALAKSESSFMGRNIKISVADPPKDRPEASRDFSDWSRRGPLPDLPQNTRQSSNRGFNRGLENASDAGSERGGPGSRKPSYFENDGKARDFSNWERKGPLSPPPGQAPPHREGGRLREGGPREREGASWGEGQSDAGSRPPRKEFEARPLVERAPTAAEQDNQWRSKMRPDAPPPATPVESTPASPAPEAPKERPRLNLAKRTVSTADPDAGASASATDSKASPFGAARPIDTAAREKEVEEKREVAVREKKEADDKAREEKVKADAASRSSRADRADWGQAEQDSDKVTSPTSDARKDARRPSRPMNGNRGQSKENGDVTQQQARPSFKLLRHDPEDGEEVAGGQDASANGNIVDDKATKPQEPIVPAGGAPEAETTAEALEDDGWSTVPAGGKVKKGRAGGRALAS